MEGELLAVAANKYSYPHHKEYDWIILDQAVKDETNRRLIYVLRYFDMALSGQRSNVVCRQVKDRMVEIYGDNNPPTARVLLGWVRAFDKRRDWRSLIPRNKQQTTNGRLHPKVEQIISRVVQEVYLTPQMESKRYIYERIEYLICLENCWRKPEDHLPVPHWSTVRRRIEQIDG